MKIKTKEYGWVRAWSLKMWFIATFICRGNHKWEDLGDPCYCGSDNCFRCANCKYETHD